MKKDKLNDKIFQNTKGKNYRKPEKIDKQTIVQYFRKLKYEVIEIDQIFRNVHGQLKKNNKFYYFKLASTIAIGERTQNEVVWNQQLCELIKKDGIAFFDMPKVCESGYFKDKFYYVSTFHDGPLLASKNPPDARFLEKWLDKIIAANIYLLGLNLSAVSLPRDTNELKDITDFSEFFYNQNKKLCNSLKEFGLSRVLEAVKGSKVVYESGVTHGDFVPWHMIGEEDKFILLDGEHGSTKLPKYYDLAYFYFRVYTWARSPRLALSYIQEIKKSLPKEEKARFNETFRPLLANRIIGAFWHTKNENLHNLDLLVDFKEKFLSNNLY